MSDNKTPPLFDLNFFKWITDLIDWIETKYKNESDKKTAVYNAVSNAFFETYAVVEKYQSDAKVDEETRQRLSKAWQDAASIVRESDPQMYLILFEKSKYWQNPAKWTDEEITAAGFKLTQLETRIKKLGLIRQNTQQIEHRDS